MPPRTREEFRVVACLFGILFLGVADNQILSPLLPAIRAEYAKAPFDLGILFSAYSLCAGVSVLAWGPLSDSFGRRHGLLIGLAIFAGGSGVSCFASSFSMLLAGRVIAGAGASMLSLNSISYAADFFAYENRGWAMGSIMASYFAALILGVPAGSYLGEHFGWRAVFGATGILALGMLPLCYSFVPRMSVERGRAIRKIFAGAYLRRYMEFLKLRTSLAALICSFFASAAIMGFLSFLGAWLNDDFGIPTGRIGLVFLISGGGALIASPIAGAISDRVGKRLQFIASSLMLALWLFVMPSLSWGTALFLVFGLVSLSAAFRQGPMEAVFTEIAASSSRGSFVALKNSFSQMGIALVTLLSGILFETQGYWAVCMLGAACSLLAAAAMLTTYGNRRL
jgi:predicted MFS family arabinose efflux permease